MFRPTMTTILRRNGASLGTLTPAALVDAALATLGSEGTPWATPAWRPALVALAADVLAEEQGRRAEAPAAPPDPKAPAAPIGAYDGEPVAPFSTPQEAREAVLQMVRGLASLPDPSRKDDVGFSVSTDSALRAFLARTGGTADLKPADLMSAAEREDVEKYGIRPPSRHDWLRAARLLLVHSKTQLPRADVLGAIRALEADLKASPLPPKPTLKALDKADYQILGSAVIRRGEVSVPGGTVAWEPYTPPAGGPLTAKQRVGWRRLTLPAALAQALKAEADRTNAAVSVGRVPGRADQLYVKAERAHGPEDLADALTAIGAGDAAPRLRAVFEAAEQEDAPIVAPAAPAVAQAPADLPEPLGRGDAFPGAPLPPGRMPSDLFRGHAAPAERGNKAKLSDFDAVKWVWDGGPTVELAFSVVDRGGRWTPAQRVRPQIQAQIQGQPRAEPRGRFSDYFNRIPVDKIPLISSELRQVYRAGEASDALDRLGPWWAFTAEKGKGEAPAAQAPASGAEKGKAAGVAWEYLLAQNVLDLTIDYDSARPPTDQVMAAMRAAGIPHRRMGARGGQLWMTPSNVERLAALMLDQGRMPQAARQLQALLPEWREMGERYARRGTPAEIQAAQNMLRRLRFTMEPADAEAVAANIGKVAPWLASVKPGALGADLGPFGVWAVHDVGTRDKPDERIYVYLDGMGAEIDKLSTGDAKNDRLGYASVFRISAAEELARALDRRGLLPLAMSLRAALLVDQAAQSCALQDDLASATSEEDLTRPEAREAVAAVLRDAPAALAPGVTLRPYQAIGVAFLRANKYRGILGDEPGLGKTLQVLAALALDPNTLPALVVAPTSVVGVWSKEARIFTPQLRVVTARPTGSESVPEAVAEALRGRWDIMVIGWDSLRLAEAELVRAAEGGRWRSLVMDEAHSAKHLGSQRTKTVRAIAEHVPVGKIAATGTLIENNAGEAWSILNLIDPIGYPDADEFRDKYAKQSTRTITTIDAAGNAKKRKIRRVANEGTKGGGEGAQSRQNLAAMLAELRVALRCVMIRRLQTEVFKQLPEMTQTFLPVSLEPAALKRYTAVMEALPDWLVSATLYDMTRRAAEEFTGAEDRGERISLELARTRALLRFASDMPEDDVRAVYEGRHKINGEQTERAEKAALSTRLLVAYGGLRRLIGEMKAPVVLDQIEEYVKAHDTPLVVFAEHKPVIRWLADQLRDKGRRVAVIDGSVAPAKRDAIIEDFQNGKYDVILGSTALRQGVTLTAADAALFAELWWNPAWINQAEMRIRRADDRSLAKKKVETIHVYAEGTVDEQVANLLANKREVVDAVLGGVKGPEAKRELLSGLLGALLKRVEGQNITPGDRQIEAALAGKAKPPKPLNAGKIIIGEDDPEAEDTDE